MNQSQQTQTTERTNHNRRNNRMNQSQQTQTTEWTNHNRRKQQNEPITIDANNRMNQSQQTPTTEWTNHNRRKQQNEPITTDANNRKNQSQLEGNTFPLALALLLIGWRNGASWFNQSHGAVMREQSKCKLLSTLNWKELHRKRKH